jgi:hypothetical protein
MSLGPDSYGPVSVLIALPRRDIVTELALFQHHWWGYTPDSGAFAYFKISIQWSRARSFISY